MRKRNALAVIILIAFSLVIFQAGRLTGAGTAEPGTSGDPLITKSYLEEQLKEIRTADNISFREVKIKAGATVYLANGTEAIVYQGNARVIGAEGLVNLTSGELFAEGISAVLYSIYLSASDSSGFEASGDITLYIRGSYKIK